MDRESIVVGDETWSPERVYRVATTSYMARGRDGFDVLAGVRSLVGEQEAPLLQVLIRNMFTSARFINAMKRGTTPPWRLAASKLLHGLGRAVGDGWSPPLRDVLTSARPPLWQSASGLVEFSPVTEGRVEALL